MLGLFIGGIIPSLMVLIKKRAPHNNQGLAFGFNTSAHNLGNLLGSLLGSYIGAVFGLKYVFYVTMGIILLSASMMLLHRRSMSTYEGDIQ